MILSPTFDSLANSRLCGLSVDVCDNICREKVKTRTTRKQFVDLGSQRSFPCVVSTPFN